MLHKLRDLACLLLCACMLCQLFPVSVGAESEKATDISSPKLIKDTDRFYSPAGLFDMDLQKGMTYGGNSWMTLEYPQGIGSLYFVFNLEYPSVLLTDNDTGTEYRCQTGGMLHYFVDLQECFGRTPLSVTVKFDSSDVAINELRVFTAGEVPDWVQKWQAPVDGETDLVLFSAHGDDEQLFFAGLLPYYGAELGYQVQVVYLTDHRNRTPIRVHEMLDGLWAVGIKTYPVFGGYPDYLVKTRQNSYDMFKNAGYSKEELIGFVVEQLRRFRPSVAVGHDLLNGEYGHGMHMMYADLLTKALESAADPEQYEDTAEEYGIWDVPKTYLHLYPENQIVMDWDRMLTTFPGMTAYDVTKLLGFPCHDSQFQDFWWYFSDAPTAKDVKQYSPCEYGLYRSTVGADVEKNDFFENIDRAALIAALYPPEDPPEPETEPIPVIVPTVPPATEPAPTQPEPTQPDWQTWLENEDSWLVYSAAGALLLMILAAILERFRKK